MLDNKSNQARIALVDAFQRGELSFVDMAKKAKRISKREREAAKKAAEAKKATQHIG